MSLEPFKEMTRIGLFFLIVIATAAAQAPEEASILISARDRYDRVITNLKKDDIQVLEDGKLRQVTSFESAGDLPVSMEVLIDTSGSTLYQAKIIPELAKQFLNVTIRRSKDMAAISSFGKTINLEQTATGDVDQLVNSIDRITMRTAVGTIYFGMCARSFSFS